MKRMNLGLKIYLLPLRVKGSYTFSVISTSVHTVYSTAYEQILLFRGFNPQTIRVSLKICAYRKKKKEKGSVCGKDTN